MQVKARGATVGEVYQELAQAHRENNGLKG